MKRRLLMVLVTFLLLLMPVGLGFSVQYVGEQSDAESLEVLRRSLHRAAVECYALEGFYPRDLSYLKERYGIFLDEASVHVEYYYLGSNLMPDITVLPVSKEGAGYE